MELIKFLYNKFILRDILGYIMPGAITILALSIHSPEISKATKLYLVEYGEVNALISFVIIWGGLFIIGFSVQCFGEIAQLTRFSERYKEKQDYLSIRYEFNLVASRLDSEVFERLDQQRERFNLLKLMCSNNSTAIFILILSVMTRRYLGDSESFAVVMLIVMAFSLFVGHRNHRKRQDDWDELVINGETNNSG